MVVTWRRLAILATVLVSAACSPPPPTDGPGGMSPAECFAKVKAAQEKYDWRSLPDHYAPEAQVNLLAAAVVPWADIRRKSKAAGKPEPEDVHFVEGILKEKGVSLDAVVKALDGPPAAVDRMFESVVDRRGLFEKIMFQTSGSSGYKRPLMVRLDAVTVDGDSARGTGVFKVGDAAPHNQELRFRRIGGRWFIDLPGGP
jgi:hypothetical protein